MRMNCPPAIAAIITEILYHGLLAIRASGDSAECTLIADHLHNLPHLLHDFAPDSLHYYWDVERPCFAERCTADQLDSWESLWARLRPHVETANTMVAVN
jgi:hypothetical protein